MKYGAALSLLGVLALAPRAAGAQESSIDGLRAAARANASDPAAALALGRALRVAGHDVDALAELRRGVNLGKPGDTLVELHWEISRVHVARRDFGQAMVACRVVGAQPGGAAAGHACAAEAHLLWGRGTEAQQEITQALANGNKSYEAKVAEGRVRELESKDADAETAFKEAIAWKPDRLEAHLAIGKLLARSAARKADGVTELRRAAQIDGKNPDVAQALASALGAGTEALGLLQTATRERPSFAVAWADLGEMALALGQLAEAKRGADAALRLNAQDVRNHLVWGRVALADNRADDALRAGRSALQIVANSSPAKLLSADAYAKKGEVDLALENYQAAWGFDHGDPAPLVRAAETCHAAQRDTSARAFATKATQEFPSWGPGWAALGDALVGQKEPAQAKAAYERALREGGPVDKAAVQKKLADLK